MFIDRSMARNPSAQWRSMLFTCHAKENVNIKVAFDNLMAGDHVWKNDYFNERSADQYFAQTFPRNLSDILDAEAEADRVLGCTEQAQTEQNLDYLFEPSSQLGE